MLIRKHKLAILRSCFAEREMNIHKTFDRHSKYNNNNQTHICHLEQLHPDTAG